MKKKIICLFLTVCMLLLGTGCSDGTRANKLVLALRAGTYSEVIKACIGEFETNNGIKCEIVEMSEDDLHSYILNDSVRKKGSYDLCMVDSSWVSEYVDEGVLSDLGELGYSFDDDIIPATTTICVQNGKTYLVPYYGNVTVMMLNTKTADALGYKPEDFDSLEDMKKFCEEAAKSGKGGFVLRGDTENNIVVDFLPVLCAFGGWVVDENDRPTVNTPEFAKALRFYLDISDTGGSYPKDELIGSLAAGKQAVAVGWPGWYNPETGADTDYIAFPGKATDEAQSYNSNIYGIWTLGIPQNSANKDMAAKLLTYLMDRDVRKSTVEIGGVPCRYSSLQDPELGKENPHLRVICTALENGIYRPDIREWSRFYTILGNMMRNIMKKEISIEDGLVLAQEELEGLMGIE